jgi:serine/threonine-protein kinase RsbW
MNNDTHGSDQIIQWEHPATLSDIDQLCHAVQHFLESFSMNQEDRFAIMLLLREALTNAVMHGSGENAAMRVKGWLKVEQGEVVAEVEDQGEGFCWKQCNVQNPHHLAETGRGLSIYRHYATSYHFNSSGNRVTLRRSLKGVEGND